MEALSNDFNLDSQSFLLLDDNLKLELSAKIDGLFEKIAKSGESGINGLASGVFSNQLGSLKSDLNRAKKPEEISKISEEIDHFSDNYELLMGKLLDSSNSVLSIVSSHKIN